MKVKISDLAPVIKDIANDTAKKLSPAADLRNAGRIFALKCLEDDAMLLPFLERAASNGLITLPSKDTATAALEAAGNKVPFPIDLPLGFSFVITLGKEDLEKVYSTLAPKEIK